MRKPIIIFFLLLAILLTACGSANNNVDPTATNTLESSETEIEIKEDVKPEKESKVIIDSYKGNPIISLPIGNKKFTFGKTKAKAILENIEEIKKFLENN